MQLEIELKLTIKPEDAKQLDQHPFILQHLQGEPQYYDLVSTYFDTADHRLQQNGWSLRVREWDGQHVQTLKSAGEQLDDLHHRHEWDQPIAGTIPDLQLFTDNQLREQIMQLIGEQPLVVLFKTKFIRKQWDLKFSDGAFVELVLDLGEVDTGTIRDPLNEIELELKAGDATKLNEIADILRKTIPLTVENRSKAERGYRLCENFMSEKKLKKIIIEGITESGEQFRPSDWAERMSGSLCTFNNHRIVYSPLLQPSVQAGAKCVVLDPALQETNPEMYKSIMEFVKENKLKTHEENGEDKKK